MSQTCISSPGISFAAACSAVVSMSQTQTVAPLATNARAISFPMPDAPAVTKTRCAMCPSVCCCCLSVNPFLLRFGQRSASIRGCGARRLTTSAPERRRETRTLRGRPWRSLESSARGTPDKHRAVHFGPGSHARERLHVSRSQLSGAAAHWSTSLGTPACNGQAIWECARRRRQNERRRQSATNEDARRLVERAGLGGLPQASLGGYGGVLARRS